MHAEALTEAGVRLLPLFRHFTGFYLAGGTALALQIGHRVSVDFDFFSNEELPRTLLTKVKKVFTGLAVLPSINNKEQLNASIDGVKTTFFCYRYQPVLPLVKYQEVAMVSVRELAAMKAFAVGQRGTYRDYVDLYFLLAEQHVTIDDIMEVADKKYGLEFNQRLFLEQLVYLDDVSEVPVDWLRDAVDRRTVQNYLEETVRNYKL